MLQPNARVLGCSALGTSPVSLQWGLFALGTLRIKLRNRRVNAFSRSSELIQTNAIGNRAIITFIIPKATQFKKSLQMSQVKVKGESDKRAIYSRDGLLPLEAQKLSLGTPMVQPRAHQDKQSNPHVGQASNPSGG